MWIGGTSRRGNRVAGEVALSSVTVIAAPPVEESFAVTGTRQLVLAVDEADVTTFLAALDRLDDPIVRVLNRR